MVKLRYKKSGTALTS